MKTLITLFISSLFLFSGIEVNAQKCKYSSEKKDPISGEVVLKSKHNLRAYYKMTHMRTGDEYTLSLFLKMNNERNTICAVGNELSLKLKNGDVIIIKSKAPSSPQTYLSSRTTQVLTNYTIEYTISKEQYLQIAKGGGITFARNNVDGDEITLKFSKKDTEKSAEYARCITM